MAEIIRVEDGLSTMRFVDRPTETFNNGSMRNTGFEDGVCANICVDETYNMTNQFVTMASEIGEFIKATDTDNYRTMQRWFKMREGRLQALNARVKSGRTSESHIIDFVNQNFQDCVEKIADDLAKLPEKLQEEAVVRVYTRERFAYESPFFGCLGFHTHSRPTFIKSYTDETTLFEKGTKQMPAGADVYFSGRLEHAAPCSQEPRVVVVAFAPR